MSQHIATGRRKTSSADLAPVSTDTPDLRAKPLTHHISVFQNILEHLCPSTMETLKRLMVFRSSGIIAPRRLLLAKLAITTGAYDSVNLLPHPKGLRYSPSLFARFISVNSKSKRSISGKSGWSRTTSSKDSGWRSILILSVAPIRTALTPCSLSPDNKLSTATLV